MLPKKLRIPRKDFSRLIGSKKYNSPHLFLQIVVLDRHSPSKFSFSVSKKVYSKAVDRNKWRRRGYSVIRDNLSRIDRGFLCFFSLKKTPTPVNYSTFREELLGLLSTARVLK
jgi:ribonuclease P protein component